jgi:hypothetical protein
VTPPDNKPASPVAERLRAGARSAVALLAPVVGGLWYVLRTALRRLFEVVFALLLIFEEWGWRPLAAALARLARIPLIARLEAFVARLPPYGALVAFALPSILIFPLKLLALYLITTGHAVYAALLFIGAKIAGTAVLARLFMLTQPQLMRIGWFARAYNWLMPWKDRAFAAIRASWAWRYGRIVKYKLGNAIRARWVVLRPRLIEVRNVAIARVRALLGR